MLCRKPCTRAKRSTLWIGAVLPVASRYRVMLRCTGGATSTLAGGGGTKVFCSQALKTANAPTMNATRTTVAALGRTTLLNLEEAEAGATFIFHTPIQNPHVWKGDDIGARFDDPPIATIRLQ